MFQNSHSLNAVWGFVVAGFALLLPAATAPAIAQSLKSTSDEVVGRVEFDFADAPPATVEVDINQGMLSAISGIGQAAISGAVDALMDSSQGDGHSAVKESAQHLNAVNEIVGALTGVVREVRVRVYEDLPRGDAEATAPIVAHYQQKLAGTEWDSVVRVHDGDDTVNVCTLRSEGAIRGVFVMVADGDEFVVANVVCELTPDRVRQVTNQATKIGMKFGLERALQQAMREIQREVH